MSNTGSWDVIPIAQIVSSAKMALHLETTDHDIWLGKLANDGVRRLNTLSVIVKDQCSLTINGGSAPLPKNFRQLIAMRFCQLGATPPGSPQPNTIVTGEPMLYVDFDFLTPVVGDLSLVGVQNMRGVFQINDGYVIFYGNMPDGSTATISYFANNIDSNGLNVVYERYEDALTEWILYNFMLSYIENYNQYVINEHKHNWMAQKRMLKAFDSRMSFKDQKMQMREAMNAMLVDKVSYGL